MKKLLCAILTIAMTAALLSGCDLFTSGQKDEENPGSTSDIKMTDNYTFEDPADLEYAKRHVIYCDQNSQGIASLVPMGVKAMYVILYADENDAPVYEYDYMIVESEESAKTLTDYYASQGRTITATEGDPCVLYITADADVVEGSFVALQAAGVLAETNVSTYVEFYSGYVGGTVQ